MGTKTRAIARIRRHERVREKIKGSAARPRLAVYRSLTHIYGQLIDDVSGRTIAAASTLDAKDATGRKAERAKAVGTLLGERAKAAGVKEAVFDRGGYRYHGRVKALADAVRAAGVKL
jgi:large subunit ribosomal protein L18